MPNNTQTLGLIKPLKSERYNVDVFNENADKIDRLYANTIEELKAKTGCTIGDIVEVLGYYTKGDGGGHPRQKKPVGYNGADAVIGADGSIWGIVHNGEIDVAWFGAKGDGITDETNILNNIFSMQIIDKINFQKSKVYKTHNAEFKIKDDVDINFNFSKFVDSSDKMSSFENIRGTCILRLDSAKNVTLENLILEFGNKLLNPSLNIPTFPITVKDAENITIKNISTTNSIKAGIFLDVRGSAKNIKVENFLVQGDWLTGINTEYNGLTYPTNCIFENGYFKDFDSEELKNIRKFGAMRVAGAKNILYRNIRVDECREAVYIHGGDNGLMYESQNVIFENITYNFKNKKGITSDVFKSCVSGDNRGKLQGQNNDNGVYFDEFKITFLNCNFYGNSEVNGVTVNRGRSIFSFKNCNFSGFDIINNDSPPLFTDGTSNKVLVYECCNFSNSRIAVNSNYNKYSTYYNCKFDSNTEYDVVVSAGESPVFRDCIFSSDNKNIKTSLTKGLKVPIFDNCLFNSETATYFDSSSIGAILEKNNSYVKKPVKPSSFSSIGNLELSTTRVDNVSNYTHNSNKGNILDVYGIVRLYGFVEGADYGLDTIKIISIRSSGTKLTLKNGYVASDTTPISTGQDITFEGIFTVVLKLNRNQNNEWVNFSLLEYSKPFVIATITQLDTPYHASNMQKLGILDSYHQYLADLHEYEKSQNIQSDTGIMNLNVIQPPVIPTEVEEYAKEYNLI